MRAILALLLCLIASAAQAQNPTCPTRPAGQSDNSCASTAFVQQNPLISIAAFGGRGDNTVDNTTPLNNALAALTGTGGCVYFPPGKYRFNTSVSFTYPSGTFSVCILGASQDSTILTWPSAAGGLAFTLNGIGSSIHIRDMTLTTGTTSGGNAILIQSSFANANPAVTAISDIYRVVIRGDDQYAAFADWWTVGVNVANVSNIQFENMTIQGPATPNGTGINLLGLPGSSTFGVEYNVAKSNFNNLTTGIVYGSFIQGVTIDQTSFTSNNGTSNGISVPAAQTGLLSELTITNSQFNVPTNALVFSTALGNVLISDSLCIARANSNCFSLGNSPTFNLTGNELASSSTTGTNGIIVGGSGGNGIILGNVIAGFATGVTLQANASNVIVSENVYSGNTANISNASNAANNTGFDLPWLAYTSAPSCGNATITNNSSRFRTVGKTTFIELDLTITALGTCTGTTFAIALPNTAQSAGAISGQEVANNSNSVACRITAGGNTSGCFKAAANAFAANDRLVVSGVYENQ